MIIYIFFSSAVHCYENHCFLVGFHFNGYVCVLHVVLKHFRENKRSLSLVFLFYFLFVLSQLSFPADILWALLILSL